MKENQVNPQMIEDLKQLFTSGTKDIPEKLKWTLGVYGYAIYSPEPHVCPDCAKSDYSYCETCRGTGKVPVPVPPDEIVDKKEARIKELEKINRNNQELVTVMSEQIHELEKYKQPEYEKAILQQARADERKKIVEWLNNHATDEIGGILLLPDELAKFQNCEITK
jgi:hypothetical protein